MCVCMLDQVWWKSNLLTKQAKHHLVFTPIIVLHLYTQRSTQSTKMDIIMLPHLPGTVDSIKVLGNVQNRQKSMPAMHPQSTQLTVWTYVTGPMKRVLNAGVIKINLST